MKEIDGVRSAENITHLIEDRYFEPDFLFSVMVLSLT